MTTNTLAPCALNVSDRALSDYRSDGLSAREMARIRAHVTQCPACQARLAPYDAIAQALKGQPELQGHAQLWQNVRASIAATSSPAAATQARRNQHVGGVAHSHAAQFWTVFGSIAAIVALSVGFVALFISHGGRTPATKTATPIVIHSGSLTWKQVIVPKGFSGVDQSDRSATQSGALIASDGKTIYACQADKQKAPSPRVWATHDMGAHWSVITPTNLPANTGGCRITLDANDASTLILSFFPVLSPSQPALPDTWVTYATFDGGATWSKPDGLQHGAVTMFLASARGRFYADIGHAVPNGDIHTALYVSTDEMQSWTRIDTTLHETAPIPANIHDTGTVFNLWANAATNEVLVETYANALWHTADDGAHWTKVPYPQGVLTTDPDGPAMIVGAPTTSAYLTICGAFTPVRSSSAQRLACTTDHGKTWTTRPDLSIPNMHVPSLTLNVIGADGSIYATGILGVTNTDSSTAIYRLPPDATTTAGWQRLGVFPDSKHGAAYQIVPTSGGGATLWRLPDISTTSDASHQSTTTIQPYYYVATYP